MKKGPLDNKGAIFIPGGLIYKDVDEMPICYDILRIYSPTKIGKRPQKYSLHIVSPEKDIGLNMDQLKQAAQKRYHFRVD